MANFRTHLTAGTITGIIGGGVCWQYGFFLKASHLIIAIGLFIIGSILPDIDAESSIPTKIVVSLSSFLAVGLVLVSIANINGSIEIVVQTVLCIVTYILIKYLLPKILSSITYHRGLIHSVPMGILISLVLMVYFLSIDYEIFMAGLLGSFLGGGFFLHLMLDELYSVNIFGARIKSSFGTALQIFSFTQPIRYILLYLVIGYVYFNFIPHG